MRNSFIAFLTDFGDEDFFVPSMKGVIASINPEVRLIDISHKVPSFNILSASFILYATFSYFPSGTIFLVVVDPGVGSSRKVLLAETKRYYFIAPDNGVLSLVLEKEKAFTLRNITNPRYFLGKSTPTFEGRDKMAPSAAWLSRGVSKEKFGPVEKDYQKITPLLRPGVKDNQISGTILHVDKFGNLITNISQKILKNFQKESTSKELYLVIKGKKVFRKPHYSSASKGELLFLLDSLDLVEVAVREGSAAQKLQAKPGDKVIIRAKD